MEEHRKQGAPFKDWMELGPHHKRRESQRAMDEIKKVAAARNIEASKIAGSVLHRLVYKEDKGLADTAKKIEQGETIQAKQTLSICHGIWLATVGGGFGKKQYRLVTEWRNELVLVLPQGAKNAIKIQVQPI